MWDFKQIKLLHIYKVPYVYHFRLTEKCQTQNFGISSLFFNHSPVGLYLSIKNR